MNLVPKFIFDDNLFDDFMFSNIKGNQFSNMRCDIYEKNGNICLEMDIPGFNKEDVNIEIDNNDYLIITAEKNSSSEDADDKNYIRRERIYGKIQRSFYLDNVDKESIEATFENGILKINMSKKNEKKLLSQKIEIK